MGAKRGSIILSRELLDEYIDARGLDQITVRDKVRWRHHCGTEWEAKVVDRKRGHGCPTCGGSQKGAFRKHPDFPQIASYVPDDATNQTKINPDTLVTFLFIQVILALIFAIVTVRAARGASEGCPLASSLCSFSLAILNHSARLST